MSDSDGGHAKRTEAVLARWRTRFSRASEAIERVTAERDAARAEVAKLTSERDKLAGSLLHQGWCRSCAEDGTPCPETAEACALARAGLATKGTP